MIPLMKYAFPFEYETKKALAEFIMKTGRLSMDAQCSDFEKAFSKKQKRKHSVLLNSGSSANLVILQALKNMSKLKIGDKVGFSALTWSTNTMPIFQMGLQPVPVDCTPETLNVMSKNLRDTLKNHKLKALFITNVLGFTGDLDEIRNICRAKKIILLEDNCEALGTELKNGLAGNFSLASSFSFYVAHHMSTIEGGMICTDDSDLAEMLRIVRANGWDRNLHPEQQIKWRKKYKIKTELEAKYTFYDLAFNLRPTEITGFLGLFQLKFLDATIKSREKNFFRIESIMKKNPDLIQLKHRHIKTLSAFAIPVICKTKELLNKYVSQFSGAGIEMRPMIAGNIQRQPFFKKYSPLREDLPGAEFLHLNSFYCGNYPELTEKDLELISSCLYKY